MISFGGGCVFPSFAVCVAGESKRHRFSGTMRRLQAKEFEEKELYRARDGLKGGLELGRKRNSIARIPLRGTSLVLSDLSHVSFEGGRAVGTGPLFMDTAGITEGIGARSFFSIATHAQGFPVFLRRFCEENRADLKTLVRLLVPLQRRLRIQEKTLVFDGGREKPGELGAAQRRGGPPDVTWAKRGRALRAMLGIFPKDRQLWLTDRR